MDQPVAVLDSAGVLLEIVANDELVVTASEGWEVLAEASDPEDVTDPLTFEWTDSDPWQELGEGD